MVGLFEESVVHTATGPKAGHYLYAEVFPNFLRIGEVGTVHFLEYVLVDVERTKNPMGVDGLFLNFECGAKPTVDSCGVGEGAFFDHP